ncbi:ABC transporter ATP-binding protein [Aureimonas fodinaquatilis]|uniref:ABC transporter ATP-binding protein n=1 Tax=Aureimonas fodinaquatilis TaxID=2565783 RepID=A0A5B0DW99_9HYPH|nr:ABC transporter ATP-binding protein [Aureimonas fodinaquatilis]KAA0971107.1 ABC transporter ATP-binding protein [Aureimonas fodinaquatilis]
MVGELINEAIAPASEGLSLEHVSKSFLVNGAAFDAVKDVSLDVPKGQFVSIVGPSGCGKSTILRLLAGLETPDSGLLKVGGRPIAGPSIQRGMVFQDHRLLPWLTVERNVRLALHKSQLAPEIKQQRVAELLQLVGLTDFASAFPHQLSGGMSQRAALARSLVTRPNVLLLDEPLGALDSLTRRQVQLELLRIWRHHRITALMVTHDVEEAVLLSSKVVVMASRPGRIKDVVDIPSDAADRNSTAFNLAKSEIYQSLET